MPPAHAPTAAAVPPAPDRRGVFGWMLFDWANQPFQTLIVTFIFAPYFVAEVIGDPVRGQALWGAAAAIAGAVTALMAPILGAIADRTGARKRWIARLLGALRPRLPRLLAGDAAYARPRHRPRRLRHGLPRLRARRRLHQRHAARPRAARARSAASPARAGRSATSAGSCRWSSCCSSSPPRPAATVTLLGIAPIFGLDPAAGEPARATGPLSAIWYVVFALPLFLWTTGRAGPLLPRRRPRRRSPTSPGPSGSRPATAASSPS